MNKLIPLNVLALFLGLGLAYSNATAQTYDYGTPPAQTQPQSQPTPSSPANFTPTTQSAPIAPTTQYSPTSNDGQMELNSPGVPSTGAGGEALSNILLTIAAILIAGVGCALMVRQPEK